MYNKMTSRIVSILSTIQENKLIPKAVQYTEDYDAMVRAEHFLPTKMWRIDHGRRPGWILWDLSYNTVLYVGDDGRMTVDMPELHVPLEWNETIVGSTDETRQDIARE